MRCAVGPCLVPVDEAPPVDALQISLCIRCGGRELHLDQVSIAITGPGELNDVVEVVGTST